MTVASGTVTHIAFVIPQIFQTTFNLFTKSIDSIIVFFTGLPYLIYSLPEYIINYWKQLGDTRLNTEFEQTLLAYAVGKNSL